MSRRDHGDLHGRLSTFVRRRKNEMESYEAYLDRKFEELSLLNSCLRSPVAQTRPASVAEVIRRKFQLAAALRAEHEMAEWAVTETAWSHVGRRSSGAFEFSYDYQRADLEVHGPSFHELDGVRHRGVIYAASGMAAISALLLASARVIAEAQFVALPGSYGETLELVEGYARHLRLVSAPLQELPASTLPRLLLLDSSVAASVFDAPLQCDDPDVDLLIFDTTCFSSGSGRIRRVLQWAHRCGLPLVLVRSHTKLDSLGAEYGRLGSAIFIHWGRDNNRMTAASVEQLATETRDAIRLLGNAALPAHFPPFVGAPSYRRLTQRRIAAILRNGRRAARRLAPALAGRPVQLGFVHRLYITLGSKQPLDETAARQAAARMSEDLSKAGFPIRHAGSFGFDFAATEWFHHSSTDRYSVRVAVPDLPTDLWDELTDAIGNWWVRHDAPA
jgi:hypothetical protein